jgi:hypothetical protein
MHIPLAVCRTHLKFLARLAWERRFERAKVKSDG